MCQILSSFPFFQKEHANDWKENFDPIELSQTPILLGSDAGNKTLERAAATETI